MQLIKLKSITPGTRHKIQIKKNLLVKHNFLFKNLIKYKHKFFGRSSINGRITVWHRGAGLKVKFRDIYLKNKSLFSVTIATAYDPNRSAFISLIFDFNKKRFFTIISPLKNFTGLIFCCSKKLLNLKFGYRVRLKHLPTGSILNNLSLKKNLPSKYVKSAGTQSQIIQKNKNYGKIRVSSGKILNVSLDGYATLGGNSNIQHKNTFLGKAGISRLKGFRPKVRGIAMNPVDHPHGGRTNSGFVKVTPWGIPTKTKLKKK